MKYSLLLVSTFLLIIGCGGGSNKSSVPVADAAQLDIVVAFQLDDTEAVLTSIDSRLEGMSLVEFFAESFKIIQERNPENIVTSGRIDEFDSLDLHLDNIADDYYFQTVAIKQKILDKLLSFSGEQLSSELALSFDVYQAYLEFDIEWSQYKNFEYPATYGFFGWPGATESLFTESLVLENAEDVILYLKLLNQIERRFQQIEKLLDSRQAAGIIEPFVTLSYSRDLVSQMANRSISNTSYFQTLNQKLDTIANLSAQQKSDFREILELTVAQRVLPAYQSLAQKMTALVNLAPQAIGFGQFTGGQEFYDFTLRYYTSGDLTADQIHQLGIQELARIHAEMRELFTQLGYPQNETISQLLLRASKDGGVISGDQAVATYEEIIAATYQQLPQAFSQIPQQQVIVVGGNSGGYYIGGSEDGTRPGAFYAYTAGNVNYWTMPTLVYHEAVPGHHLQIALAKELDLPRFRREMNFTAFIEGWGLYAERLAKDLGWYQNNIYADIGRLQFEAMRASRLVIDTGIHSNGWSYQQAEDFSQTNIGEPGSIARYSIWPGQATAYMSGMLKILELRASAQSELGELYDIKDFHQAVIGNGSMPLNLLEQAVNNYIEARLPPP